MPERCNNAGKIFKILVGQAKHKKSVEKLSHGVKALCAIVFLYKHVLKIELNEFGEIQWSKKPRKLPVVFTHEEAEKILNLLEGKYWLMAMFLYGSGLRLLESLRLRIKDIDFYYKSVTVRDGKGQKDRTTILANKIVVPLEKHIKTIKSLHEKDLANGYG